MSDIILETRGLTKHYGGVHALEDADFELYDETFDPANPESVLYICIPVEKV